MRFQKNPEAEARSDIQTRGFPSPFLNGFGFYDGLE